jgi:hypothetical protein
VGRTLTLAHGTTSTNSLTSGLMSGNVNFDGAGIKTFWIGK